MKVLVGCEFSGTVRDAFIAAGHEAFSCDLLPAELLPEFHFQCDIKEAILRGPWDLIVLHVPCTAMGVCGNRHYGTGKPKSHERTEAIEWSLSIWELAKAYSPGVALENPASVIFPFLKRRGADVQYVHPWEYGHPEQKKTGLALHNLPRLKPTNDVYEKMVQLPRKDRERIFFMSPSDYRGHLRSIFFPGIAKAMAEQWGNPVSRVLCQRQPSLAL